MSDFPDFPGFSTEAPPNLAYIEVPLREVRSGPSDLDLDAEIAEAKAAGRTDMVDHLVRLGLVKP